LAAEAHPVPRGFLSLVLLHPHRQPLLPQDAGTTLISPTRQVMVQATPLAELLRGLDPFSRERMPCDEEA